MPLVWPWPALQTSSLPPTSVAFAPVTPAPFRLMKSQMRSHKLSQHGCPWLKLLVYLWWLRSAFSPLTMLPSWIEHKWHTPPICTVSTAVSATNLSIRHATKLKPLIGALILKTRPFLKFQWSICIYLHTLKLLWLWKILTALQPWSFRGLNCFFIGLLLDHW